jgi:hypothetical protein
MNRVIRLLLIASLLPLLLVAHATAQTLPIITVNDAFGVDAWKEDADRVGFKVQIRLDAALTWTDVPAVNIQKVVLPDTMPGYVTLRMAVSAATPVGDHTLRIRYCDGATCTSELVFLFTFATGTPALRPPLNPRVVPKGGGVEGAVDLMGWLMDVPRPVR